jgi:antitoxin component YwqK of YwqJK toxin-antitoxin module
MTKFLINIYFDIITNYFQPPFNFQKTTTSSKSSSHHNKPFSMKKLLIIFILYTPIIFAQSPFNQIDSTGQKEGEWIQYLSAKFKIVDSSKAVFKRIVSYDHGKLKDESFNYDNYITGKLYIDDTLVNIKQTENPIWLNGKIKTINPKGNITEEMEYRIGRKCGKHKNFYWGSLPWYKKFNGIKLHEFADYDKKYNAITDSHYVEIYDKNGTILFSGYNRNGERGWMLYPN